MRPANVRKRLDRDPGRLGPARARRDHEARRAQPLDLRDVDGVVADDAHLRAELTEPVRQIPGERVVVVDEQDHQRQIPLSAISSA